MIKPDSTPMRAPRGSKPVMLAFLSALDTTPEATRSAVAKAALTMIRDALKARREKVRAVAAKQKARQPVPPKPPAKTNAAKPKAAKQAAAPVTKPRRPRKPAGAAV